MEKDIIDYGKDLLGGIKKMFAKTEKGTSAQPNPVKEQDLPDDTEAKDKQLDVALEDAGKTEPTKAWDYISFSQQVRDGVRNKVNKLISRTSLYNERILHIIITDKEAYRQAAQGMLDLKVNEHIENSTGVAFKEVRLASQKPVDDTPIYDIIEGVVIAITKVQTLVEQKPVMAPAVLSMCYPNAESRLVGGEVTLLPEEEKVWNIGWGTMVMVNDRPRYNDIALEYSEPEQQDNKVFLISRAHAHIRYAGGTYYLYVEEKGTRKAGKRTMVVRGQNEMELSNVKVGEPLKNGDIIRLNKQYLKFKRMD